MPEASKPSNEAKPPLEVRRKSWPRWVKIPLFGCKKRGTAMTSFWLMMMATTLLAMLALQQTKAMIFQIPLTLLLLPASMAFFFSIWYYIAIQWVDRRDGWKE